MATEFEKINENEIENVSGGGYVGPCFKYTIKKGDCLSVIAERYGTTVKILQGLNSIQDANLIYAGNTLLVPYKG